MAYNNTVNLKRGKRQIKKDIVDNVYEKQENEDLQKIEQPKKTGKSFFNSLIILIILVFVAFYAYNNLFKDDSQKDLLVDQWHRVTLVNGDIYYCQVKDLTADPVVVKNIYYDYDQQKTGEATDSGHIRLVKKGAETYGPDGTMNIVRSQVISMEPLSDQSKVLLAILEYEK